MGVGLWRARGGGAERGCGYMWLRAEGTRRGHRVPSDGPYDDD